MSTIPTSPTTMRPRLSGQSSFEMACRDGSLTLSIPISQCNRKFSVRLEKRLGIWTPGEDCAGGFPTSLPAQTRWSMERIDDRWKARTGFDGRGLVDLRIVPWGFRYAVRRQ